MQRVSVLFIAFFAALMVNAQTSPLPSIRTGSNSITMYLDNEKDNFNGVNLIERVFNYSFVTNKETSSFILVSEKDSLSMTLRHNADTKFYIIREAKGDTVLCNFSTHQFIKSAIFSDEYKKANQGKTIVEIPEVYELFNIVLSLGNYGKTGAIEKQTEYYQKVLKHFTPYANDRAVLVIDSLLAVTGDYYPLLKMDSYAYEFNNGKIGKGAVYDRISWGDKNELEPYIPLMESFAAKSGFRGFYKDNSNYFSGLINDFKTNVDVASMKNWLEKQFPKTKYSSIKVIFSPLVGFNQSANNFSDNGFTEAQAHINFPFTSDVQKKQPAGILKGRNMIIAFTEINHSYLNPEADNYLKEITVAYKDLSKWITKGKPSANYNNSLSCFEEYMNYGLVTLFFSDIFDQKTFEELKLSIEKNLTELRGFQRFREFDDELLRLYKNRAPGKTVADLYPAIISWSAAQ